MGFPDYFKHLLAVVVCILWLANPAGAALYVLDGNGDSTKVTTANGHPVTDSGGLVEKEAADNCAGGVGDPSANGAVTLEYLLPISRAASASFLTYGWVAVYADTAHEDLAELIHFDGPTQINGKNYDQVFFYSSGQPGGLAGQFPASSTLSDILASSVTASITENADGIAAYAPECDTTPGFDNGGPAVTYDFISSVPEPGDYGAFGGGLLLLTLAAGKWRRLRKRSVA